MFVKLAEKLSEYTQANPEAAVNYQVYAGDNVPLIVAIVTALVKRVHNNIEQAAELIFVDATSNAEAHNLKIFLMCTHSVAGALPLGLPITSDEKESTLKCRFTMLKNCLPDDAFYGNGPMVGPKIILTDNCQEERNALKDVWASANLLLCTFSCSSANIGDGCWIRIIKSTKMIDQEYWVYLRKSYIPLLRICLNGAMRSFLTKQKRHILKLSIILKTCMNKGSRLPFVFQLCCWLEGTK